MANTTKYLEEIKDLLRYLSSEDKEELLSCVRKKLALDRNAKTK
jgi:hypothetical protein